MLTNLLLQSSLAWVPMAWGSPATLLAEGMAAQRAGEHDVALKKYSECLLEDPNHVRCHWEIGWSYWVREDWRRVVRHWEAVARLEPAHEQVHEHLPKAKARVLVREVRPPAARPPIPRRPKDILHVRAVGDLTLARGAGGESPLAPAKTALDEADLAFANIESPFCDEAASPPDAFRMPTALAADVANAGIDLVSVANDRVRSAGVACQRQTEQVLRDVGIGVAGERTVASRVVGGHRVALAAFHADARFHDLRDLDAASKLVRRAARLHDIVIVSFHGGVEGPAAHHVPEDAELEVGASRGRARAFARTAVKAGASLVLGHGPGAPRGLELIDGHLVAYSLGRFLSADSASKGAGGAPMLAVELDPEGRLVRGRILPFRQGPSGLEADPARESIAVMREWTDLDFPRGGLLISANGYFAPRHPDVDLATQPPPAATDRPVTRQALEEHLARWPTSDDADRQRKALSAVEAEAAQTAGTVEAYEAYLAHWPEGSHAVAFQSALPQLRTDALEALVAELPTADERRARLILGEMQALLVAGATLPAAGLRGGRRSARPAADDDPKAKTLLAFTAQHGLAEAHELLERYADGP